MTLFLEPIESEGLDPLWMTSDEPFSQFTIEGVSVSKYNLTVTVVTQDASARRDRFLVTSTPTTIDVPSSGECHVAIEVTPAGDR